jgi:hypothetical protein
MSRGDLVQTRAIRRPSPRRLRGHSVAACVLLALVCIRCSDVWPQAGDDPQLEALLRSLFAAIESLSDYRARPPPPVHWLAQHELEEKICEEPCNVSAAYLPGKGVYLAANLDPWREDLDRSALLHELVHYLQQGHAKFAALTGCARERAKEKEATAIQNAYLDSVMARERVMFNDDFDCEDAPAE